MIQLIRGFKDILSEEMQTWKIVTKVTSSLLDNFGYNEICTPLVENSRLFIRSIGEKTDIVEKEMYTFPDRNGTLITLRPEATASIVRAYIQHKMYSKKSLTRLYTIGPMFRRERPQKGRYRQFYQLDVEAFGTESPYIDAEIIFVLNALLGKLLKKDMVIHLNSLGCYDCRPLFKTHLSNIISKAESELCSNCFNRKNRNPLRILDCKNESCRKVVSEIKPITDFLCYDCKKHFDEVIALLSSLDVSVQLNKHLVRGLDYYTRTVFEVHHSGLGSKTAIAGGGRYDNLVKNLGGPDIPAVGFAIGLNRLIEIIKPKFDSILQSSDVFFAVLGEEAMKIAFKWQMELNSLGIKIAIGHFNNSLKSQMKHANRIGAPYVLIVGDQELKKGEVVFKDMKEGSQFFIPTNSLVITLRNQINKIKYNGGNFK